MENGLRSTRHQVLLDTRLRLSTLGEDEASEVYVTSLSDNGLYRVGAR